MPLTAFNLAKSTKWKVIGIDPDFHNLWIQNNNNNNNNNNGNPTTTTTTTTSGTLNNIERQELVGGRLKCYKSNGYLSATSSSTSTSPSLEGGPNAPVWADWYKGIIYH